MAVVITLPGFKDLERSVIPIFPLTDYCLYRFSTFGKNIKKIYGVEEYIVEFPLFSSSFICVYLERLGL